MTEILCTFPNEFYYLSNNLLRSGPPGTVLILEQGNIIVMGHDLRFCRGTPYSYPSILLQFSRQIPEMRFGQIFRVE